MRQVFHSCYSLGIPTVSSFFQSELNEAKTSAAELQEQMEEMKGRGQTASQELVSLRNQNEKLSCQLSELSSENLQGQKTLKSRNESLSKMVSLLETDLDRKKSQLEDIEAQRNSLEQEFESYKVRAASVLRQAKEKDSTIGAKTQEVAGLERLVQALNEKITDMRYIQT